MILNKGRIESILNKGRIESILNRDKNKYHVFGN